MDAQLANRRRAPVAGADPAHGRADAEGARERGAPGAEWLLGGSLDVVVQVGLSGARKAAILVLALGEGPSSEIFKHLQEDEVEKIAKELAALGRSPRTPASACSKSSISWRAEQLRHARRRGLRDAACIDKAKGPDASRRILDRVTSSSTTAGFATLEKTDPQQLSKFILAEHPQTIALILAHLNATNAAQLVSLLPDALRADVLTRMANLDEISPEVITQISARHRAAAEDGRRAQPRAARRHPRRRRAVQPARSLGQPVGARSDRGRVAGTGGRRSAT